MREDTFEEVLAFTWHRITKEQALKPVTPRIGLQRGQAYPSPVDRVDTPADRGFFNPIADQREIFIIEVKPVPENARAKQSEDLRRGVAAARQIQKRQERVDWQAL